jgi:hypothetical protein
MAATAPPATPHKAGFTSAGSFILSAFQFSKRNGSFSLLLADIRRMTALPRMKLPPLPDFGKRPVRSRLKAAKMTPDQIAEAQRMAREWQPSK